MVFLFFFFLKVLDLSFDEETVVSSHSFCSDFPRNAWEGVVIDQNFIFNGCNNYKH